ncbi:MAG: hypothetical protein IJ040_05310, partial [Lachnospiraceae bacterium]|nr:hypothetical protein [Lachnospiraceae bacterium]
MAKIKRLNFDTWQYWIPDKQATFSSELLTEMNNQLLNAMERLSGETEFTNLTYVSQFDKLDEAVRIYDALCLLQDGVMNELYERDYD